MKKVLENVLLLDGHNVRKGEVLFVEEGILDVKEKILEEDAERIDGKGLLLLPSLVDVHVHLRDPGYTKKETIHTGTLAAAHGGFLHVFPMPNLMPCPDDPLDGKAYLDHLKKEEVVSCHPYASLTKNQLGKEIVEMEALYQLGFHQFSDDGGESTEDEEILQKALTFSQRTGCRISFHCEDKSLEGKTRIMFSGRRAKELGIEGGMTDEAEASQARFYIQMAKKYGGHIHICHVSAKKTVEAIKEGQENGVDVTGEATCHHLTLTDKDVSSPKFKMSPPLKPLEDVLALRKALKENIISIIASDHAPHTKKEKDKGMEKAPFGIVSLETSLPILYAKLVLEEKLLSLPELIDRMSLFPAERFLLKGIGRIAPGYRSDFFLFDPNAHYRIDSSTFLSKGKNTPYEGWDVIGEVIRSYHDGKVVYERKGGSL